MPQPDKPRIALLIQPKLREELFFPETLDALSSLGDVVTYDAPQPPRNAGIDALRPLLEDARIVINSWGTLRFDEAAVAAAPKLELIVYLAGSVKVFTTDAVWDRKIRVTSAAHAIGSSVAELVVGQAILARRNAFRLNDHMKRGSERVGAVRELWASTVGIVSLGNIGRLVARYVQTFGARRVLGYDPYAPDSLYAELGIEKADLDTLVRESDILTVHAPALPETEKMISAARLKAMKDDAVLINTSRGSVIDEPALIAELEKGRLFACLDVTDPEPPAPDSPLRRLPNVLLTPHIAGPRSRRIGEQGLEEVRRFLAGEKQVYEITRDRLAVTA